MVAAPASDAAGGTADVAESAPAGAEARAPAPTTQRLPHLPPGEDVLDDLASELDARFAASMLPSSPPPPGSSSDIPDLVARADDMDGVRQLFGEMAGAFMSQVRDFMVELRHTDASTAWIEVCEPALQSLRTTCGQLDAPQLVRALDEYVQLLEAAKGAVGGRIAGELREAVLACYDRMVEQLPEAFEVSGGREPVIVQLLLLQVPGVHKRTVDKLFAAGVHHLEAFLRSRPDDLAAVAAIDVELAARIVAKFQDYRRRVSSLVAPVIPDEEREILSRRIEQLREQDEGYEKARAGWSTGDVAAKRRYRRQRGQTLKEIYVVLARMGEVDRIDRLQKLPVRTQLEDLERFLDGGVT